MKEWINLSKQRKIEVLNQVSTVTGLPPINPNENACAPRINKEHRRTQMNGDELTGAVGTGLEPATPCVTGTYSNQLNYPTKFSNLKNCISVLRGSKIKLFLIVAKLKGNCGWSFWKLFDHLNRRMKPHPQCICFIQCIYLC